jgi:hypothetical protein
MEPDTSNASGPLRSHTRDDRPSSHGRATMTPIRAAASPPVRARCASTERARPLLAGTPIATWGNAEADARSAAGSVGLILVGPSLAEPESADQVHQGAPVRSDLADDLGHVLRHNEVAGPGYDGRVADRERPGSLEPYVRWTSPSRSPSHKRTGPSTRSGSKPHGSGISRSSSTTPRPPAPARSAPNRPANPGRPSSRRSGSLMSLSRIRSARVGLRLASPASAAKSARSTQGARRASG